MAKQDLLISVANPGPILVQSKFNNYDLCLNPYVGCQFGCTYCYVRWLVKDDDRDWGDFVRVRSHMAEKLPQELDRGYVKLSTGKEPLLDAEGKQVLTEEGKKRFRGVSRQLPIGEARLVLGTLTDPYQPVERKHRITRTALEIILGHRNQFQKVGIFTRSPIVLDDIELIRRLPLARVHFTITPFPPDVMRMIEPISPKTERRWAVLRVLKEAGIRLHVNVSPVMPIISDEFVQEWAEHLAEIGPAEFFVDPMQPYKESFDSFEKAMEGRTEWPEIRDIMTNRVRYDTWKRGYEIAWTAAWKKVQASSPDTLPIWCDHAFHVWRDMRTGEQMSHRFYHEEAK